MTLDNLRASAARPRALPVLLGLVAATGLAIAPAPAVAQGQHGSRGALLIDGSGDPPVADAAFLVEGGVFASVGRRGEREPPAGAVRVDLAGKTASYAGTGVAMPQGCSR